MGKKKNRRKKNAKKNKKNNERKQKNNERKQNVKQKNNDIKIDKKKKKGKINIDDVLSKLANTIGQTTKTFSEFIEDFSTIMPFMYELVLLYGVGHLLRLYIKLS